MVFPLYGSGLSGLGNGDFVESVLASNTESMKRKYVLQSKEIDLDEVSDQVGKLMGIEKEAVWAWVLKIHLNSPKTSSKNLPKLFRC